MTALVRHELDLIRDWAQDNSAHPLAVTFDATTWAVRSVLDADPDGFSAFADVFLGAFRGDSRGRHARLRRLISHVIQSRDETGRAILAEIDRTAAVNGKRHTKVKP